MSVATHTYSRRRSEDSNGNECQVCHRIDFHNRSTCKKCHWPITPITLDAPTFGFDVAIQVRVGFCQTDIIEKHFMTADEKVAVRRARRTSNFIQVLAVRPLTESQFVGGHGDPRDKSRFS